MSKLISPFASGTALNPEQGGTGVSLPENFVAYQALTPWTPVDASGAGLALSNVNCAYMIVFGLVYAFASFAYPVNADGTAASISGLPVSALDEAYSGTFFMAGNATGGPTTEIYAVLNPANSHLNFKFAAATAVTNTQMGGKTFSFLAIYPTAS